MPRPITLLSSVLALTIIVGGEEETRGQHFPAPEDPHLGSDMMIGEPCQSIARPTTSFGSVVHDGWLYVIGGYHGRPHDYNRDGQSADFYRINLHDLSHQQMLPHSQGMQSCPLETWGGEIIRIGGLVANNAPGESAELISLATVRAFDPETGSWRDLPDMPAGRSSHDTAITGSTLHVFGGWNLDATENKREWYENVWSLDLADPDAGWTSHDAPFKRRAMASVSLGDRVAVLGGMTPKGTSRGVELFDPASGEWTSGPDYPEQAFGLAADAVDGRVVATGSDGGVLSWMPEQEAWAQLGTTTFPRFFHQVAADHQGDLIVIGGISGGMRPNQVERVAITSGGTDQPVVRHWTVPSPSNAKNRQAFFVRNGWIYMFGGNNSTGQHDFAPENFVAEGYRLNPATMTWRACADYPMPRQSIQTMMAADKTSGFALGGFGFGEDAAHTHREGCRYDFKKNEWTVTGPHLPVSRSQFGLAQDGERYWVFGGLDYDPRRKSGDQFRHLQDVMVADLDAGDSEFADSGIDLPRTRRAFGGVTVDRRYYLLGGMTDDFQLVDPCDVFDFEDRSWAEISPPARTRLSPEAVAIGPFIFLAGGMSPKEDGSGLEVNPSLERYDTRSDEWTTVVEELPCAMRHVTMLPFRGQLLIFSSHESDANLAHLILVNPFKDQPAATMMPQMTMAP